MKPKWFYDEIYEQNYYYFLKWCPEEAWKCLEKQFPENKDIRDIPLDQMWGVAIDIKCVKTGKSAICIYVNKKAKGNKFYQTLAHECLHATNMCFSHRKVHVETDNDEHHAFYLAALVKKALEK